MILFLFFQAAHSFAQLQLDEDEWRKQRDDHKYGVEQKDETKEKAIDKVGNQFNINSTAEAIKLVFFIIIIAALLFLIYKFILDNQRINSGDEGLVFVEDLKAAEENLMRADLQKLLDKFISEKDYRSAIRTQYLQVIQTLNKQKRIKWAKDKTNLDYYMELREKELAKTFKSTTLIYEKAWFGRLDMSFERYTEITALSSTLNDKINE